MEIRPLKVSEVNLYIKKLFANDMILSSVTIEGEISNFKHHYSGHMYFNLKDDKGKIKSVMFKGDNQKVRTKLEDGLKIIATGQISTYEKEGDYQFYIKSIKESGIGELYQQFTELKAKLELEGLFDSEYKKEIPKTPKKIGVVTSATGAAIRDIITVIKRRFPPCNILIYPSLVQGVQAPKEICEGLVYLDNRDDIDLIITGRGGGSIEELFAFNDEKLARTIFALKTPIISAVGHETDFTIADFVADLRAATPSAAAEISVPDIFHLQNQLNSKYRSLIREMTSTINTKKMDIEFFNTKLKLYSPINKLKDKKIEIDSLFKDLNYFMEKNIQSKQYELNNLKNKIQLNDPLISLDKGYGILINNNGKLIKSVKDIEVNEEFSVLLKDGRIVVTSKSIDDGGFKHE